MSLILDALNRSRQDVGDIPGLDSQHQPGPVNSPASSRWWALALLVALIVIAFLLFQRGDQADVSTGLAVVAEPGPAAPQPQVPAAPVFEVVAPSPAVRLEVAPAGEMSVPVKREAEAEVAALYGKKTAPATAPAAPQTPVSEQAVDLGAMVAQAQSELENAQLEEHSAPFLADLSQQTKDGIPTIYYQRHDYSGRPGLSELVLNGKVLKRGGQTATGVTVDEILPDSVVLSYQGTQFRLRALNSWINL